MVRKKTKSRRSTNSPRKSGRHSNASNKESYDPKVYEVQITTLKKKTKEYQYVIDSLKDLNSQLSLQFEKDGLEGEGLIGYIQNCIQHKDQDISELKENLSALCSRMNEKQLEHNNIVAKLRFEIEAVEEKLNSEKAVLTGKIASLEDLYVERAQLHTKTIEMENLIGETRKINKFKYHEKDLELTVTQDQLYKEMLRKLSHLAEEFRIATEKRVNKTERRTLESNYTLNEKLSCLSTEMLNIMGKNKSYKQATKQLKHDVHVLRDVRNEMHKNWSNQIQSLKHSISNCLEKEKKLFSIKEMFPMKENVCILNKDLFQTHIDDMNIKGDELNEEVHNLRSKYDESLSQFEEYKYIRREELHRLKQLIQARNHLCQLVSDCKTALQEAYEMYEPESNTKLNFTERVQRFDHLLTAFFIIIYTCDQLISRITPYQIGDFRWKRLSTCVPSASTRQSLGGQKVMFSDSVQDSLATSSLANVDSQTRKTFSGKDESTGSNLESVEKDDLPIDFPLASKFGLEPVDPNKPQTINSNLLKELSKCSRQSGKRTNTPSVHTVAVQTEPIYNNNNNSNNKKQTEKFKQKRSIELIHFRNRRGILHLPLINSTILAPKECYDELYSFNIRPIYKHKSPQLPSLYQLAKI
uniref:Cilia- and flagella-associated protein 157 n=1 Tax=Trichobilharzia regenti TaxID=157069 RepID=A0AA85KAL8_TRIRE|nr:unnamed protein product [Trichobilharzia regenti]